MSLLRARMGKLMALLVLSLATLGAAATEEPDARTVSDRADAVPRATGLPLSPPRVDWVDEFAHTGGNSWTSAVAVGRDGTIVIVGEVGGSLPGFVGRDGRDGFVRAYSPAGDRLWTDQFGTDGWEWVVDVTVGDRGDVYVVGFQSHPTSGVVNAYVRAYSASGARLWVDRFGGARFRAEAHGVAVDAAGRVVVGGCVFGALGGQQHLGSDDGFLRVYSRGGDLLRTDQFGTPGSDAVWDVATDGQGWTVAVGSTGGALRGHVNQGSRDAFVRVSSGADVVWTRQFGSEEEESADAVAVDRVGNISVVGRFPAGSRRGVDAIRAYEPSGALTWMGHFDGLEARDVSRGLDGSTVVALSGDQAIAWRAVSYSRTGTQRWTHRSPRWPGVTVAHGPSDDVVYAGTKARAILKRLLEPPPSCAGLAPTVVGTSDADVLVGTPGPDVIVGRGGDDLIQGLDGDDVICAGVGNDLVLAGGGGDRVFGERGHDKVRGGDGADELDGGRGNDVLGALDGDDAISGGPGTDRLNGGLGNDHLSADGGDDRLIGSTGADTLFGGGGRDRMVGGSGDDVLVGDGGNDVLQGREGNDALDGSAGIDRCNGGPGVNSLERCEIRPGSSSGS